MELEKQVCSLELAKRLKELEVKQSSYFYWCNFALEWTLFHPKKTVGDMSGPSDTWLLNDLFNRNLAASAFTVAELGELLPNRVSITNKEPFDSYTLVIRKFYYVPDINKETINCYIINYECDTTEITGENAWLSRKLTKNTYDPNLANAMAKMLIYLIENGLMKNE